MAIRLGLQCFPPQVRNHKVAIFSDNVTAIAYLKKQGGTESPALNLEAQSILRWTEEEQIPLVSQFISVHHNVLADTLSRKNQVIASEWTLVKEVVHKL